MQTRWIPAATLAALAACAHGEVRFETTGAGGASTGGATSSSSAAASTSASSAATTGVGGSGGAGGDASSSGNGGSLCGNGHRDPGEPCEGDDFGGLTCELLGYASGQLSCTSSCDTVLTGCVPEESCDNGKDDNFDGKVDCDDVACAATPACLDSCAGAKIIALPGFTSGDTTGRADVHKASCSSVGGREIIYQVVASVDGVLSLGLYNFLGVPDFSLSVRAACDDDASEIACSNQVGPGGTAAEVVIVDVTAGTTYFVMVEGDTPADQGPFTVLQLTLKPHETDCTNLIDDDLDGHVDCDGPSCQALPVCAPGPAARPAGQPCTVPSDCQANHLDPVCLSTPQGFPGGYCSEFCDLAADDCAPGALCWPGLDLPSSGVCLQTCATDADCSPGFGCSHEGLAQTVCVAGPEGLCTDYQDNDGDGLIDCQDPGNCQSSPACVPGSAAAGQPCSANTDCFANAFDPICLDAMNLGFAGGYCSEFCDPSPDDCGLAGVCAAEGPGGASVCMHACTSSAQCRAGYSCVDLGYPKKLCI